MQGLQGNVANMGSMGGGDINFQFLVGGQQSRHRKLPRALQNTYKRKKPAKRDHGRLLPRAACGFAAPEEGIMVSTILDEMSPPERIKFEARFEKRATQQRLLYPGTKVVSLKPDLTRRPAKDAEMNSATR